MNGLTAKQKTLPKNLQMLILKKKRRMAVNEAGNYTKPKMRKEIQLYKK